MRSPTSTLHPGVAGDLSHGHPIRQLFRGGLSPASRRTLLGLLGGAAVTSSPAGGYSPPFSLRVVRAEGSASTVPIKCATKRPATDPTARYVRSGRDAAGVHWRSDGAEGLKLGEAVAIGVLTDTAGCFNERPDGFFIREARRQDRHHWLVLEPLP